MSAERFPGHTYRPLHFSPSHNATNLTFLLTSIASTLLLFSQSLAIPLRGNRLQNLLISIRVPGRKERFYGTFARQPASLPGAKLKADSSGTKTGAERQVHRITHELTCILPHYWLADGRACRQDLRSAFALKGRFSPQKRQTEQCSPTPLGGAVPQFYCPFPAFPSSYRKCRK